MSTEEKEKKAMPTGRQGYRPRWATPQAQAQREASRPRGPQIEVCFVEMQGSMWNLDKIYKALDTGEEARELELTYLSPIAAVFPGADADAARVWHDVRYKNRFGELPCSPGSFALGAPGDFKQAEAWWSKQSRDFLARRIAFLIRDLEALQAQKEKERRGLKWQFVHIEIDRVRAVLNSISTPAAGIDSTTLNL